jgi:hypothetical protein
LTQRVIEAKRQRRKTEETRKEKLEGKMGARNE